MSRVMHVAPWYKHLIPGFPRVSAWDRDFLRAITECVEADHPEWGFRKCHEEAVRWIHVNRKWPSHEKVA